jgi:cytochrome c553
MGERSLPQCAKCHYARVKLKKHKIKNKLIKNKQNETVTKLKTTMKSNKNKRIKVK